MTQSRTALRNTFILLPILFFFVSNTLFIVALKFVHVDSVIKHAYNTNTMLLPVVLLVVAIAQTIFRDRTSTRHYLVVSMWVCAALFLAGIRLYATHIEPYRIQVRELTIPSEKVVVPLKILHLSDIQSTSIGTYEESVFARIQILNPDVIIHTGDFLQPLGDRSFESEVPKLARLFETLSPPLGIFTVEGESDWAIKQLGPESLGGPRFLHTDSVVLTHEGVEIRLLGLSLKHSRTRRTVPMETIESWLDSSPPGAVTILFGHRPDFAIRAQELPIDLCLAGHTHGGQIRIPFYGAIMTSSGVPRDWALGYRHIGQTQLNVSAGIGAGHNRGLPSIRINCPPEMTLITLTPPEPNPLISADSDHRHTRDEVDE